MITEEFQDVIRACEQCGTCTAACPCSDESDFARASGWADGTSKGNLQIVQNSLLAYLDRFLSQSRLQ